MKDVIIHDTESGLDLYYTWHDKSGYSFRVSGYESREDMKKAIHICRKHWPKVPEHLQEDIDKHNLEIIEACRSIKFES